MYCIFALCSMLGYALQCTLLAPLYRITPPATAAAIRGLTLGLTMLPLLLLVKGEDLSPITRFLPDLFLAIVFAGLGNILFGAAMRTYSAGVANALCSGALVVCSTVIDLVFFQSTISALQIMCVATVLAGNTVLGTSANGENVPRNAPRPARHQLQGAAITIAFGIIMSLSYTSLTVASRALNPYLVGYLWETGIGFVLTLSLIVHSIFRRAPIPRISLATALSFTWRSAPTAIGTGFFAAAIRDGPLTIVTAIGSATIAAVAVLSYFLYGERLVVRQILALILILGAILALKLLQ